MAFNFEIHHVRPFFADRCRSLYYLNQVLAQRTRGTLLQPYHAVCYVLWAVITTRLLIASVTLFLSASPVKVDYLHYDTLARVVHLASDGHFDHFSFAVCAALFLDCIVEHYNRHYQTDGQILGEYIQLVGETFRQFSQYFPDINLGMDSVLEVLRSPNVLLTFGRLVNGLCRVSLAKVKGDNQRFERERIRNSMRTVLCIEVINLCTVVALIIIALMLVSLYMVFYCSLQDKLHWPSAIAFLLDLSTSASLAMYGLYNGIVQTYINTVLCHWYHFRFKLINQTLQHSSSLRATVRVMRHHTAVVGLVSRLNRRVLSRQLFGFLCAHMPANLVLMTRTLLGMPIHPIFVVITAVQFLSLAGAMALVLINRTLFRAGHMLGVTFARGSRTSTTNKMVHLVRQRIWLVQRLEHLSPYGEQTTACLGLSVGPLGLITTLAIFQSVRCYTTYALFLASTML